MTKQQEDLGALIEEVREVRREARALTRSGHPGVRAEALRALQRAEDYLRWLYAQTGKPDADE